MRPMHSDTSTNVPGTSSALALQTDYTMPCNPNQDRPFTGEENAATVYVVGNTGYWSRDTQDAHFQGAVTVTGEFLRPPDNATLFLIAAYSLLQAMPQSGLEESCRALNEIFEYHTFRPLAVLRTPALPRMKAKLRPMIKQSGFQIEAE